MTALENACFPLILDGVATTRHASAPWRCSRAWALATGSITIPAPSRAASSSASPSRRALLINPLLILADEPTGNLDSTNALQIIQLFRRLVNEMGKTIVVATHDLSVALKADRVVMLRDGHLEGDLRGKEVTLEKLEFFLKAGTA